MLSYLWYLAGRDEAFAMLVLLKRQQMAGRKRRGGAGATAAGSSSADLPAMLQVRAEEGGGRGGPSRRACRQMASWPMQANGQAGLWRSAHA